MSTESIHLRCLPHWYMPGAAHFVTYRLAGTLPANVVGKLKAEKERVLANRPIESSSVENRRQVHKLLFAKYEHYLDTQQQHINWLRQPRIAAVIRSNLYHHHGSKYHLMSYCVMPNHVHVLLLPMPNSIVERGEEGAVGETEDSKSPLSSIMHSLKSFTANKANRLLGRTGKFWQPESYDHWVRDDDELERIVNYIRANPVKAGLVAKHEDWYFSSCHDRLLTDGDVSGWLLWDP